MGRRCSRVEPRVRPWGDVSSFLLVLMMSYVHRFSWCGVLLFLFPPGSVSGREEVEIDRARGLLGNHSLFHQVGFMKTGKIVALEVEHYSNAGNSVDLSKGVSRASSCTSG